MTRQEAIETYFAKTKKARVILERIMRFDPEKSVKENAIDLGIDYGTAFHIMRKYFK